jgi:hypothetical protein
MSETRKQTQEATQDTDGRARGAKPEALSADQEDKVRGGLSESREPNGKLTAN